MSTPSDADALPGETGVLPGAWIAVVVCRDRVQLRAIVERARALCERVLLVDARPAAGDAALALDDLCDLDVEILPGANGRGAGELIRDVFRTVRSRGGTHVLTLRAEDHGAADALPGLLESAHASPRCVIVGARDFSTPGIPRSVLTSRRLARLCLRMETGLDLPDPQSTLRVYPIELMARVPTRSARRAFDVEILTRAGWAGIEIRSVDVPVAVAPPTAPKGLGETVRLVLTHARLMGRQLVPWPHARLVVGEGAPREVRGPRAWLREQLREHATPAGLAASAFVGIFLGVLPLLAMHIVTIVYVTARLRLNKVLALAVQNLCMPPFVPVACIQLGHYVLHGRVLTEASFETVVVQIPDRLLEWLIGSVFLAPALAVIAGGVTYVLARLASRASFRVRRAREP